MVVSAHWMMGKLLHPKVWISDVLVLRTKLWLRLRSRLALSWSKPYACEILIRRGGEMLAMNSGAGESTSTCSWHC